MYTTWKQNGKSGEADGDYHVIENVPNCLAVILAPLLDDHIVMSMTQTVTGPQRLVADGIWAVRRV